MLDSLATMRLLQCQKNQSINNLVVLFKTGLSLLIRKPPFTKRRNSIAKISK